ncbi:MAG: acylphosphatase [Opitutales bacterium]|nr:acylphosphatase [Opitutales bacterium]
MTVVFEGHVQGVGFRMQTLRVARGFEVAGTVENLPDGTVRLIAEGVPAELRAFVAALTEEMRPFIRKTNIDEADVPATLCDFKII